MLWRLGTWAVFSSFFNHSGGMISPQPCKSHSRGQKTVSPLCAHSIVFILPDTDGQQPFDTLNVVCGENIGVLSLFCINCIFFSPLTWACRTACIPTDSFICNALLHLLAFSSGSYLIWALAGTCGADRCTSLRRIFLLSAELWPPCIRVACH